MARCAQVILLIGLAGCAAPRESLRLVAVPVADLRAQPGGVAKPGLHDPLQETQVLYAEAVRLIKTEDAWAFVEAIEQPEYTHANRWQGYPGWILNDVLVAPRRAPRRPQAIVCARWAMLWRDAQGTAPWFRVPMGTELVITNAKGDLYRVRLISGAEAWITRGGVHVVGELKAASVSQRRQLILRAAQELIGDPYFWGGRSPHAGSDGVGVTGVDCSGLVNLAYRTAGLHVPRDAHELYLRAKRIPKPQPADLVFLSEPDNPRTIVHVMLYAGDGWLIEGPGTGLSVRRIEVVQRLGRPIEQWQSGDQVGRQTLFFGAYLSPE